MKFNWNHLKATVVAFAFLGCFQLSSLTPQQLDSATVVQGIDASVRARIDNVAGYSVTEHYAVFRGQDETHPAAEMIVKTVYRKGSGKSYTDTLAELDPRSCEARSWELFSRTKNA